VTVSRSQNLREKGFLRKLHGHWKLLIK